MYFQTNLSLNKPFMQHCLENYIVFCTKELIKLALQIHIKAFPQLHPLRFSKHFKQGRKKL